MSSNNRFALSPITPDDYPALANIAILAFMRNSLHYLTYPPDVSHEAIVQYTLESKVKFAQEGREVQTIKVVDNQTPDQQIVGFATWFMGPRRRNREPQRPHGADFKFLEDFKTKLNPISKRVHDEKDIGRTRSNTGPPFISRQGYRIVPFEIGTAKGCSAEEEGFPIVQPGRTRPLTEEWL